METNKVLLGHFFGGDIRVVFYFSRGANEHGRGVADFSQRSLMDVLSWIESTLFFEKEKVQTVF